MSRVIKFRVWDIKRGAYWDDHALSQVSMRLDGKPQFWTGDQVQLAGKFWPDEAWIREQFTGLLDKNGREIYEGDIVRVQWKAPAGDMEDRYVVRFGLYEDGEGFPTIGFYSDHTLNPIQSDLQSGGNLYPGGHPREIIGNLHQNPEMLTPTP